MPGPIRLEQVFTTSTETYCFSTGRPPMALIFLFHGLVANRKLTGAGIEFREDIVVSNGICCIRELSNGFGTGLDWCAGLRFDVGCRVGARCTG